MTTEILLSGKADLRVIEIVIMRIKSLYSQRQTGRLGNHLHSLKHLFIFVPPANQL